MASLFLWFNELRVTPLARCSMFHHVSGHVTVDPFTCVTNFMMVLLQLLPYLVENLFRMISVLPSVMSFMV